MISLKPYFFKKNIIYSLSIRHADIPESCVRYVGAIVNDVIKRGSEVKIFVIIFFSISLLWGFQLISETLKTI